MSSRIARHDRRVVPHLLGAAVGRAAVGRSGILLLASIQEGLDLAEYIAWTRAFRTGDMAGLGGDAISPIPRT